MEQTRIYPGRECLLEVEKARLERSNISVETKNLIHEFRLYLDKQGAQQIRKSKLMAALRNMAIYLHEKYAKDFTNLEPYQLGLFLEDIKEDRAIFGNRKKPYSERTKSDFVKTLKRFYLWLYAKKPEFRASVPEVFIETIKEIRIKKYWPQIDPSQVISDDDVKALIDTCYNIRDKAFIQILHEGGFRIGEMLGLKIKDLVFKENLVHISLNGKTGRRIVPLVRSIPYLMQYLEVHPIKEDPECYLWLSFSNFHLTKPLMYAGARKLLKEAFKRSGINKPANPHFFRHSRASLLSNKMHEQSLHKYMGWVQGSGQTRTYCHMSIEQIEENILDINGLAKKEQEKMKPMQKCICQTLNSPDSQYCRTCGKPLSVEIALKNQEVVDREINKTIDKMKEVFQNPELLAKFEQYLQGKAE